MKVTIEGTPEEIAEALKKLQGVGVVVPQPVQTAPAPYIPPGTVTLPFPFPGIDWLKVTCDQRVSAPGYAAPGTPSALPDGYCLSQPVSAPDA